MNRLGARPRKERLRAALNELCRLRPFTPNELGHILGVRPDKLVERHLGEMVAAGELDRLHPDTPNRPDQAYRTSDPASTGVLPFRSPR